MLIEVTKGSLENAIQIVSNTVKSGTDDADIYTHYVFRVKDGKAEILASDNTRMVSRAPLTGATCTEDGVFSAPGWRLKQWLGVVSDDTVTLSYKDAKVTAKSKRGTGRFSSLDTKGFRLWDDTLAKSETKSSVATASIYDAISYVRPFIGDQETKNASIVATECIGGTFYATNAVTVALVAVPGMGDATPRVYGKDIPTVLAVIGSKGSDTTEIRDSDSMIFFVRTDGSYLGVSRWLHPFPPLKMDMKTPEKCSFTVTTADLKDAMRFLAPFAASEVDPTLQFRYDATNGGKVIIGVVSNAGDKDEQDLTLKASKDMDKLGDAGYTSFSVPRKYIDAVAASSFIKETITFGLDWNPKKNGYVVFRSPEGGPNDLSYYTVVGWKK